ncbi:uncharacterized protein HMPREF1541_08304 [Cyphellophora europaea CBS 101466]|uniref:D-lactate dehydratase n=1 Tax=Cyphellophora europaea (strain CBS 101466) TaxID=1220924 RepID=W2RNP0_CYPE1|nr:uncharacterized protein HMPREF1541_08304 [Cyphellophora europaea CBS 101466]ETN37313.1 hypothetical protein HMPREF1541_08304 [Cyphellophora europaea CBS 101466]
MATNKPHVLVVLSSAKPGWFLPELAHPYHILAPHCTITIASHLGGAAPLDPLSISSYGEDAICAEFMKSHADLYANTAKLEDLIPRAEAGEFDAIFYVGGYGPMFDIVDSPASAKIIQVLYANKKLLTGVCHGPAAFAHVNKPSTQEPLLKGHKVTGVSNKECELLFPVSGIVEPWSVEDELAKATAGGYSKAAEPYGVEVVLSKGEDGRTFVTGQNPSSGLGVGKAVYKELFGKDYEE